MTETFLTDQPWIVLSYKMTDEQSDELGYTEVQFECCICGDRSAKRIPWPKKDDPVWDKIGTKGLPAGRQARNEYQLRHLHIGQQTDPILTWARPLRNIAALGGALDLEQLAERLRRELTVELGKEAEHGPS